MKVDILIPARNEARALAVLLTEIDQRPLRQVVVVDNGSTDHTARVARGHGCRVVSCPVPGYGRACLAGLSYLREDPPDILIFLDGDRSDHPKFIPQLLEPLQHRDYDFVLGSRTLGQAEQGSLTFPQRFGNALATRLMRWFWGVRYTDLAPFRAIRWPALEDLDMQDTNYGWTIEMQIKAAVHRLRTLEVPVDYRNRIGVSKISGTFSGVIKAGSKIMFTLFKYRFLKPVKPQPRASQSPE